MLSARAIAGAVAALALLAAAPTDARDALDRDTLLSGSYRRPIDLSAYAPSHDALPPKHRFVVVHRYGLRGILPQTLENLSDEMGLTRERVRQIQLESLRRLRHMARESGLDGQALFS